MDLFASVEKTVAWSDTWKAAPVLLHSPDIHKVKGALNYNKPQTWIIWRRIFEWSAPIAVLITAETQ